MIFGFFFFKLNFKIIEIILQNALTHSVPVFKDGISGTWNAPDNLLNKSVFMRFVQILELIIIYF